MPSSARRLIQADLILTALFGVVSLAVAFGPFGDNDEAVVALSLVLFAVGISAFIASFFIAAERSRREYVGAAGLYVLTGPVAPSTVKRSLLGCLLVQVVLAFAVAIAGVPGSEAPAGARNPLAFASLVPMLGFGLNGLWVARHGTFESRIKTFANEGRDGGADTDDGSKV